jgi:RimJ/RimL family protein N-acetyltransferase
MYVEVVFCRRTTILWARCAVGGWSATCSARLRQTDRRRRPLRELQRAWQMPSAAEGSPRRAQASQDPAIPEGTTVPARYTEAEGRPWMQGQWSRAENGEGLSLAISKSDTREAVGTIALVLRPAAGMAAIGYWIMEPEPERGHGHASRAVTLLSTWAVRRAGLRGSRSRQSWNRVRTRDGVLKPIAAVFKTGWLAQMGLAGRPGHV